MRGDEDGAATGLALIAVAGALAVWEAPKSEAPDDMLVSSGASARSGDTYGTIKSPAIARTCSMVSGSSNDSDAVADDPVIWMVSWVVTCSPA